MTAFQPYATLENYIGRRLLLLLAALALIDIAILFSVSMSTILSGMGGGTSADLFADLLFWRSSFSFLRFFSSWVERMNLMGLAAGACEENAKPLYRRARSGSVRMLLSRDIGLLCFHPLPCALQIRSASRPPAPGLSSTRECTSYN